MLYADDIKIAKIIKSQQDTISLQQAIDKLRTWCECNHLHLNLDKCAVLTISKGRSTIHADYLYGDYKFIRVNEHKDLGVLIDQKLSFTKHIASISSKACAALGFVKRFCYDIADTQTLKQLYYALVQSHLDYCSVVWLPFHDIHRKKIESIQKQFTMFALKEYPSVANNFHIRSYQQRLNDLNMISLQRRRLNASLIMIYDILNGHTNCPSIREEVEINSNLRSLRRREYVKINDKRMKLSLAAPLPQMCKFANLVPDCFTQTTSRSSFITSLRNIPNTDFGDSCPF